VLSTRLWTRSQCKIQVGASGSFCFQTEDSVAFIKEGAALGTLVSKQLRAQLVQLVQLSRRSNCRAVEEAHVRAGFAGFESRKGGLM
jgi:hypothetical protein